MKPSLIGAAARETYQAPALATYGTIATLTQGHSGSKLGSGLISILEKLHQGGGGGGGIIHRIPRS